MIDFKQAVVESLKTMATKIGDSHSNRELISTIFDGLNKFNFFVRKYYELTK